MKKGENLVMVAAVSVVILLIAVLIIFGKSLFSVFGAGSEPWSNVTTIAHKDFRASIDASWNETEVSPSLYLYFPPGANRTNENAEVIMITSVPMGNSTQTLDQVFQSGIQSSKKLMPDLNVTKTGNFSNGKFSGREVEFTGTQSDVKRFYEQVFGVKYNTLYSITYTCPVAHCLYYQVLRTVENSFQPINSSK